MNHTFRDLTGQTFGNLLVLEQDKSKLSNRALWFCRCKCGAERSFKSSSLVSGHTKNCGCKGTGGIPRNPEFTIDFTSGCHICTSHACDNDGYPQGRRNRKTMKIARIILTEKHPELCNASGVLPTEIVTRHKCDNKKCINPDHLEPGSIIDNNRDRYLRGIYNQGEANYSAKLNSDQAYDIYNNNTQSRIQLANFYNISKSAIDRIKQGQAWQCVLQPIPQLMIGTHNFDSTSTECVLSWQSDNDLLAQGYIRDK